MNKFSLRQFEDWAEQGIAPDEVVRVLRKEHLPLDVIASVLVRTYKMPAIEAGKMVYGCYKSIFEDKPDARDFCRALYQHGVESDDIIDILVYFTRIDKGHAKCLAIGLDHETLGVEIFD